MWGKIRAATFTATVPTILLSSLNIAVHEWPFVHIFYAFCSHSSHVLISLSGGPLCLFTNPDPAHDPCSRCSQYLHK